MYRLIWIVVIVISISAPLSSQTYRAIDGSANNLQNPNWGTLNDNLKDIVPPSFNDGISRMNGEDRPNPRHISNYVFDQKESIVNQLSLSDYLWAFGQFLDHDVVLVESDPFEPLFIKVPEDDEVFEPGSDLIMFRSIAAPNTGTGEDNPRKYQNHVTAFVDGSAVYGSDIQRANWLRTFEGGKMKTSKGNLLPWNTLSGEFNDAVDPSAPGMEDATRSNQKLFIAGDVRANENPLLISIHTLFVREHNNICEQLAEQNPSMSDEELYQSARRKIGAYLQNITFNEWLPAMGVYMPLYSGYKPEINPQISNTFSAAAFRLGHTLINSDVIRMNDDGEEINQGNISLRDAFFNPLAINLAGGIEPYLRGMAQQESQELDSKLIDDLRNFLFPGRPFGSLDLAALNINRGRERGLPDFNSVRVELGLPELKSFQEFTQNDELASLLEEMYGEFDKIDPWVGMLAEKHMPDAMLGNTLMLIIERQFQALRDGDRYYFENDPAFSAEEVEEIKNTTFQKIIMRNADITTMQEQVFVAANRDDLPVGPEISRASLSAAAFPNPSDGSFLVKIYEEELTDITLQIFDAMGKQIMTETHTLREGDNFIPVNIPETAPTGFYNILIQKQPLGYTVVRVVKR